MTDDTKPQRIQPASKSPMADNAQGQPAPVKRSVGRPAKERVPLTAPTENQLEALRPPQAEAMREEAPGNEPVHQAMPERVPFGALRAKLALPPRDGFQRRWFTDVPGRIEDATKAGWVHIIDERTNRPIQRVVTKNADGGEIGYAMETPNEFYDEDYARKQEALDITDEQIYTGINNEQPGDNRYVPPNTMKFGSKRGRGSHIA